MLKFYTATIFLSIFSMAVMRLCVGESNTLDEYRKKLFKDLFLILIIAPFCEWLGVYLDGKVGNMRVLHIVAKVIELSLAPCVAFLFSWIIEKKKEWMKFGGIVILVNVILECLSGIFGFIYYVDANNFYHHGSFYWLYVLAYVISFVFGVYIVMSNAKKYQYSGTKFFAGIVIFMMASILIQMCDSDIRISFLGLSVTAVMLYVCTLEMIQQTDGLTELLNRRGYENCITNRNKPCVVMMFDVDNFKNINDTLGHAYGDAVLKEAGVLIKKTYASSGKCFRYGGDEFNVILTKQFNDVEKMNTNFFMSLEEVRKQDPNFPLISIGYAFYDPNTQNIEDVVKEADAMMYMFKQTRKKILEETKRS